MLKNIISVAFDDEKGTYKVSSDGGTSVNEIAFAMNVIVRCLVRENVIEDKQYVLNELNKYLTDPQWDEVKNNDDTEQ